MLLLLTRVPGLLCRDKGSSEPVIPCPTVARGVRAVKSIPAAKPNPVLAVCPGSAQLHPSPPTGLLHMGYLGHTKPSPGLLQATMRK